MHVNGAAIPIVLEPPHLIKQLVLFAGGSSSEREEKEIPQEVLNAAFDKGEYEELGKRIMAETIMKCLLNNVFRIKPPSFKKGRRNRQPSRFLFFHFKFIANGRSRRRS